MGFLDILSLKPVVEISAHELQTRLKTDASYLLDVRTPGEYALGHLKSAINIDVLGGNFMGKLEDIPRDQPVYVYCRSGSRSAAACRMMKKAGFANVVNVSGGIMAWKGEVEK
jgi:rhodanese-related sulfurtransferase